jgi:hypothetical protein
MTAKTIQNERISDADLSSYRGQWVVIRDGEVIQSGSNPSELRRRPGVRSEDTILLVPRLSSRTLLL